MLVELIIGTTGDRVERSVRHEDPLKKSGFRTKTEVEGDVGVDRALSVVTADLQGLGPRWQG